MPVICIALIGLISICVWQEQLRSMMLLDLELLCQFGYFGTSMCDERARMLQDQFNVSMNHVHALAILVSTFHHGKHPSAIDQVNFPSALNCFYLSVASLVLSVFRRLYINNERSYSMLCRLV